MVEKQVKKTAQILQIDELIIEKVLRDQWKRANEACRTLQEVEISGLGIFYPSLRKLTKRYKYLLVRIENHLDDSSSSVKTRKEAYEHLELIENVKKKDELKRYLETQGIYFGGYKESYISKESSGGDFQIKDGDL
jgi:hypothetical protein